MEFDFNHHLISSIFGRSHLPEYVEMASILLEPVKVQRLVGSEFDMGQPLKLKRWHRQPNPAHESEHNPIRRSKDPQVRHLIEGCRLLVYDDELAAVGDCTLRKVIPRRNLQTTSQRQAKVSIFRVHRRQYQQRLIKLFTDINDGIVEFGATLFILAPTASQMSSA